MIRHFIDLLYIYMNLELFLMMPACSSTLTKVLPHWNAMLQTHNMTPHPVTAYRYRADLSLCYPLMWIVTLEATSACFNVLGLTRWRNPSRPSTHAVNAQLCDVVMVAISQNPGRKSTILSVSQTRDLWCANPLRYPLDHSCFLITFFIATGQIQNS